jgi:hypothetical protein
MSATLSSNLTRYCVTLLWQRRSCLLVCLIIPVLSWSLPLLTPWQTQAPLLQPARVQTGWMLLWLSLVFFFVFQAAALGRELSACGLLEHSGAARRKWRRALCPILGSVGSWVGAALLPVLALSWACRPTLAGEASAWNALLLQQAVLFAISASGLLGLAAAIATRFSQAVACLAPFSLWLAGWALCPWLESWLNQIFPGPGMLFVNLLPRYDLADLTARLVFKLGPLPAALFTQISLVLLMQSTGLIFFSRWITRGTGR